MAWAEENGIVYKTSCQGVECQWQLPRRDRAGGQSLSVYNMAHTQHTCRVHTSGLPPQCPTFLKFRIRIANFGITIHYVASILGGHTYNDIKRENLSGENFMPKQTLFHKGKILCHGCLAIHKGRLLCQMPSDEPNIGLAIVMTHTSVMPNSGAIVNHN